MGVEDVVSSAESVSEETASLNVPPRSRKYFTVVGFLGGMAIGAGIVGLLEMNRPSSIELANAHFQQYDRNKDGSITYDEQLLAAYQTGFLVEGMWREIKSFVTGRPYTELRSNYQMKSIDRYFRMFDQNRDGRVARQEYIDESCKRR